jgi:hypothetical protein
MNLDLSGVQRTEAAVQEWCDSHDLGLTAWLLEPNWVLSAKNGAGVLARGKNLPRALFRATGRTVHGNTTP